MGKIQIVYLNNIYCFARLVLLSIIYFLNSVKGSDIKVYWMVRIDFIQFSFLPVIFSWISAEFISINAVNIFIIF
jgi:hypothetical protein